MKFVTGSLPIFLPLAHLLFVNCLQNNFSEESANVDYGPDSVSDQDQFQLQRRMMQAEESIPHGHVIGLSTTSRKYWDPENNWYFEVNDATGNLHGSDQLGAFSDDVCIREYFKSKVAVEHCTSDAFSDRRPVFARGGDSSGWTKGSQAVTLGTIEVLHKRYLRNINGNCELSSDTESYCARTLEELPDFPTSFLTQASP